MPVQTAIPLAISFSQTVLPLSKKLIDQLRSVLHQHKEILASDYITINFRDKSYSAENGGYHPVEIGLQKEGSSSSWIILYITDFGYHGYPYAELAKDLDFDFSTGTFSSAYSSPQPINHRSVKEMFTIWQQNFLSYLDFDVFDQIKVST